MLELKLEFNERGWLKKRPILPDGKQLDICSLGSGHGYAVYLDAPGKRTATKWLKILAYEVDLIEATCLVYQLLAE